jgi:Abnormal spindle-like microcephaly-assoc'd, ASPM-SPD-2-Hydin/Cep192 domain 4
VNRFCWSKVAVLLLLNVLSWTSIARGQLSVSPASVNFGNVPTGTSASKALALSNSGKSDLTVSLAMMSGPGFSLRGPSLPLTLASGQTVTLSVVFAPVSDGSVSGTLSLTGSITIIHDRSNKHNTVSTTTTAVSMSGTGFTSSPAIAAPGVLGAYPSSLGFASIQVGSSQTLSTTVTNSGGSDVTITQATILQAATTGNSFTLNGISLPATLAAGQRVTFSVTFAPLSAGSASGSIAITSDASTPTLIVPLAGSGTEQGQLAVSPLSVDFGSVTVGTSKTQSGTIVASGSSVTLSSAGVTDSEFSLSGITFPVTVAAGQSLPFTLTFIPRASGTAAATLSFTSNAANTAAANLTGTGVAPPQHSVDLSWNTAPAVVGYNVYRGSQAGGPYSKINTVLDASTVFTDSSVQGGQSYYYVTTSVDSTGAQSSYSNEIQTAIPSP